MVVRTTPEKISLNPSDKNKHHSFSDRCVVKHNKNNKKQQNQNNKNWLLIKGKFAV